MAETEKRKICVHLCESVSDSDERKICVNQRPICYQFHDVGAVR